MENASKALLIAGGVLISILILTVGVYLYTAFSGQGKEYKTLISTIEIQKFNSDFEVFNGKTNVTPYEIATAVKLAEEYKGYIQIDVYNKNGSKKNIDKSEDFIQEFINSIFSCKSIEYNDEGKITKLVFKENN